MLRCGSRLCCGVLYFGLWCNLHAPFHRGLDRFDRNFRLTVTCLLEILKGDLGLQLLLLLFLLNKNLGSDGVRTVIAAVIGHRLYICFPVALTLIPTLSSVVTVRR